MFYIYESLQCSITRTEKFSPSSRFFVSSSILPPLYKEEDKPHVERQDENSHNAHHQYDDDWMTGISSAPLMDITPWSMPIVSGDQQTHGQNDKHIKRKGGKGRHNNMIQWQTKMY